MKKILVSVFTVLLGLSLFSSCSNDSSDTPAAITGDGGITGSGTYTGGKTSLKVLQVQPLIFQK